MCFIDLADHDVNTTRNMFFLYPGDYDNNPSHEMTGGNSTSTETQTHHGDVMTSESRIHDEMYKHLRVLRDRGYAWHRRLDEEDFEKLSALVGRELMERILVYLLAAEILWSLSPYNMEHSDMLAKVIAENIACFIGKDSMLDILENSGHLAVSVLKIVVSCLADSDGPD